MILASSLLKWYDEQNIYFKGKITFSHIVESRELFAKKENGAHKIKPDSDSAKDLKLVEKLFFEIVD